MPAEYTLIDVSTEFLFTILVLQTSTVSHLYTEFERVCDTIIYGDAHVCTVFVSAPDSCLPWFYKDFLGNTFFLGVGGGRLISLLIMHSYWVLPPHLYSLEVRSGYCCTVGT